MYISIATTDPKVRRHCEITLSSFLQTAKLRKNCDIPHIHAHLSTFEGRQNTESRIEQVLTEKVHDVFRTAIGLNRGALRIDFNGAAIVRHRIFPIIVFPIDITAKEIKLVILLAVRYQCGYAPMRLIKEIAVDKVAYLFRFSHFLLALSSVTLQK